MKRTGELLESYGLRWEQHLKELELQDLFESQIWNYAFKRGRETIMPEVTAVASWLLFHSGHLRIRKKDKFFKKAKLEEIFQYRPGWLTDHLVGVYNLGTGKVSVSWFSLLTYDDIETRGKQAESGDLFFAKISEEYQLKTLFDKEEANRFLGLFLESELLETTTEIKQIFPENLLMDELFVTLEKDLVEWFQKAN